MNDYQLGFTHACRLIKSMIEESKNPIDNDVQKIFDHVEQDEIKAIQKGVGLNHLLCYQNTR